jgi:two-component system cell cycle response regulator
VAETILIVDDEPNNRALLEAILTEAGYEVRQAEGGEAALAQVTSKAPDLILLDLMMPGMSGIEVCRRLKQDPATSAVPIIIVTALGQLKNKESALTSGADDFVTKPVDPEDLRARVGAMLKVRRIHQDLDRTLAYLHELEAARHAQRREALDNLAAAGDATPSLAPPAIPILLVDDEALTREFYGDLLTEHGFRVVSADSGAEAIQVARHQPVEAVILDIMMPGMSGLETLERLHDQAPELPVIMLTANASSQNAIAALKLGAFDFILKGLEHDLMVLAVHRAVRHYREAGKRKEEVTKLKARIAELEGGRLHSRTG